MKVINACKPPPREMKKCSLSKYPSSAFLRNVFVTVQFTAWAKKSDACPIFGGKRKKEKKIPFLRKKKEETTHTSSAGFWFRLCPTLLHLAQTKAFYIYRTLCSRATGSRGSTESCASPTAFIPFPFRGCVTFVFSDCGTGGLLQFTQPSPSRSRRSSSSA